MSKFNQTKPTTHTTNLAGGRAYKTSEEFEFVSILFTSFVEKEFYRTAAGTINRLEQLINQIDPVFAAKAIVYTRKVMGMRSITHVAASLLSNKISGTPYAKEFYAKVINRPDDITEILSVHKELRKQKITHGMKNGLAKAFDQFNAYNLAKYRMENKSIKLIDAVKILHPIPTERNKEALTALINGNLKSFDTWEKELSQAGQDAESAEEKLENKKEVWVKLLNEKKLGYFALLRNLRNIKEQAPEMVKEACAQLIDRESIKKSLVMPFRFLTAYNEFKSMSSSEDRLIRAAIENAIELSLDNMPKFEGSTLIAIDTSGSMRGTNGDIARLFGAALARKCNADIIKFDESAKYENYNLNDSIFTIYNKITFPGGATNFKDIFRKANKKYDRIVIFSDMQGWVGYHTPLNDFNTYCTQFKANPIVYSFDLAGYGTTQLPQSKILCIAGFSDKIFDVMEKLEQDKHALFHEIENIITL